eukprot:CAMPEP_0194276644 /NCGR_PEP_ID=MMETSP0169-20130528/9179_1 /TAXON_ID=218684 /ORGANISM="Corethron pennatum, Strain L29A3" /LENGTH=251 /DNA_ID=CAMNT_0039020405 /DNA_START=88 /DNA_END=840 /DNA_ORIENTATION=-
MGERPPDFDESLVRKAPTFRKWLQLKDGEKLRYACRDFCKGKEDAEERLMRRIMIARRNNIKDHEELKRARVSKVIKKKEINSNIEHCNETTTLAHDKKKKASISSARITPNLVPNGNAIKPTVNDDMDIIAIENTRTYKKWMLLEDGQELRYNHVYHKGKAGQDNHLRKNIWRRMKYRRSCKNLIETMNEKNLKYFLHHPMPQQEIAALEGTRSDMKSDEGNAIPNAKLQNSRTHTGTRGIHQSGVSHQN